MKISYAQIVPKVPIAYKSVTKGDLHGMPPQYTIIPFDSFCSSRQARRRGTPNAQRDQERSDGLGRDIVFLDISATSKQYCHEIQHKMRPDIQIYWV
jgi:hypothetical protein